MLTDLEPKSAVIHIRGREYRARYSLNSLLCLEMCCRPIEEILKIPVEKWSIEDILQLTRAALCDLPGNKQAVVNRDWKNIKPDIAELGTMIDIQDLRILRFELADAVISSLPKPVIGAETKGSEVDYLSLRGVYCDVMGRSDKEFWTSTLGEIKQRTDTYMELKGYKKPVEKVQMFEH